jgi:hypothetical protein
VLVGINPPIELPDDWKTANVIPIHKGGDVTAVENYRPISLISIPCMLLESTITDQVKDYLKSMLLMSFIWM